MFARYKPITKNVLSILNASVPIGDSIPSSMTFNRTRSSNVHDFIVLSLDADR